MPGQDRTGPMGAGPMTGRGMGNCASYPGSRPGFGTGRGARRGRFFSGFAPVQPVRYAPAQYSQMPEYRKEDEMADLKAEKELIERELGEIKTRLKELDKETKKEK